jgi:hypothetical protein
MTSPADDTASQTPELDVDQPHSARMYDYYLGGKTNYPADRKAAEAVVAKFPQAQSFALANRRFLHRSTRFAAQTGIRQFLDIGAGIPTPPNLHQIAQDIAPASKIVYVDNDPLVLIHAQALMGGSSPDGQTDYVDADLGEPAAIIRRTAQTLDLAEPVALSLIAVLHFFPDADDPYTVVGTLLDALAPGSLMALSHITADFAPTQINAAVGVYRDAKIPAQARSRGEVARFFDGLELVEPGLVVADRWRPDTARVTGFGDADVSCYAAVARKPA